jgi:hypothetical protein
VIGPVLYGAIVVALLPSLDKLAYQIAILSLLILMLIGFFVVRTVPMPLDAPLPAGESRA